MLTDIFAERYANVPLWQEFRDNDRRFIIQSFRIVAEQLYPYYNSDKKENPISKEKWTSIHDKLSMELGLEELSEKAFLYNTVWQGKTSQNVRFNTIYVVCKNFVCAPFDGSIPVDRFMKERISFVEIAFRERHEDLIAANQKLERDLLKIATAPAPAVRRRGIRAPGDRASGLKAWNQRLNQAFTDAVNELNVRMKNAGYDLNYHNGFIQRTVDPVTEEHIEAPYWTLVSDPMWKNVDLDMKEAIDRRDSGSRDPALYAARALESTIKIISDEKGWTHGNERGAHNYIDNLGSNRAENFITGWESGLLKDFFTHVRNPLGHGPGNEEMPELSPDQTTWAIEFCMSWVKSLILRLG